VRLSGEFHTDLPLPDTLTACVEALDELGWRVESVETNRIESIAVPDGAVIEIDFAGSRAGTDVRITGAEGEEHPLEKGNLIAVLDQGRDAIEHRIEAADGGDRSPTQATQIQPVDREDDSETAGDEDRDSAADLPPAGWFPDPDKSSRERFWDGDAWTNRTRVPPGDEPADGEGAQANWWDRHRRSVAIGALAFLIGGAVGAAADSSDSGTVTSVKTKRVQGPTTVNTETQTVTDTQKVTTTVTESAARAVAPPTSGGSATSNCDPNYGGECLDPGSLDYDCEGGGGDGPDYVTGPVAIIGSDHYDLDSNGNGVGCE
jgi:hypothetical protein